MQIRPSLIVKLTLATSLILIGFMWLLDHVNLRNFRKVMIDYAASNVDQMAEIINQSAYDAMMKNDKAGLYQLIDRIAQSRSIEHLRLIDRSGKVVYSNIAKEIGTMIDKKGEACSMCHGSDNPRLSASSMNRSRIYQNTGGTEGLGFTKAIYNQPGCSAGSCHFHRFDDKVLGVLDISVSLDYLQQKSHEYRLQFIVMACMLLVLISILMTYMTKHLVDLPVQRLVRHTALVASGNMDARVPVTTTDELGHLSEAVNHMTDSLGKARKELREWASSLEHKVEERSLEIKRIEAQLYRSEKLASLGKLVAGIAHEINNPLTGILLYSSILSNDRSLDPMLKQDLDKIISESRRCADIVRQLLEFSREAVPHKESSPLGTIIDKVLNLIQHQPTFFDIDIVLNLEREVPDVYVDPNQIQQVFVNLFINACHAMPDGGTLTITTSLSPDGAYVSTEIRDTGHGIAEEDLPRIFDPFFTTKSDGTGLGLSISYGLVENNAGKIEVKSTLGVGSAFLIMLPVHRTG
ncbi:sensor histidine kinase [Geobacter sp. SVR]|uniref:sensor histidine kinase n=1 Tax=Geobacter sp. SVR TaxID=2495594 RepID=UPI00143F0149|nr:ATP-binding protein [Geobacter sp. SVR]BCS54387.1 two-component sensor histidine kinase [Geobacter sp. SVR]GCF87444.1 two-component sensor histidine kinase [Geobacter sp. SVR]